MGTELSRPQETEQTAAVRRHLERVLGSVAFRGSRRCQDFLRYVVEETLEGRAGAIKERTIATAVFGKDDRYEPSEDAIVRVKAVEVRKRLTQFYAAEPGDGWSIVLRPGSYVPVFSREAEAAPPVEVVPVRPRPPGRRGLLLGAAAGVAAAAGGFLAGWAGLRALGYRMERSAAAERGPNVERLWRPLVATRGPVLIGVPAPDVYALTRPAWQRYSARPEAGMMVKPGEVAIQRSYWVGMGAVHGAASFAAMLAAHGCSYHLKTHAQISYGDLRSQPSLLLGGSTSPWGRELTRGLRFVLAMADGAWSVVDTQDPARRWTTVGNRRDGDVNEDFALITRVRDGSTGHVYLEAAGVSPRGTQAAVEFVTREELLAGFAAAAPADWGERNFQIVVHCQVHERSPGRPDMVTFVVW